MGGLGTKGMGESDRSERRKMIVFNIEDSV